MSSKTIYHCGTESDPYTYWARKGKERKTQNKSLHFFQYLKGINGCNIAEPHPLMMIQFPFSNPVSWGWMFVRVFFNAPSIKFHDYWMQVVKEFIKECITLDLGCFEDTQNEKYHVYRIILWHLCQKLKFDTSNELLKSCNNRIKILWRVSSAISVKLARKHYADYNEF